MSPFYFFCIWTTVLTLVGAAYEDIGIVAQSRLDWNAIFRTKRQTGQLSGLTNIQKQIILDTHNEVRRLPKSTDMTLMRWDEGVARHAQSWSRRCSWDHSPDRKGAVSNFRYIGENLYAGTAEPDMEKIVWDWYGEVRDYDYRSGRCTGVCGHYTQVVWAKSYALGCGMTYCPSIRGLNWRDGGYVVVCNYGPGGNIIGRKPYTRSSPACSDCPVDWPYCDRGLCSTTPHVSTGFKTDSLPWFCLMSLVITVALMGPY